MEGIDVLAEEGEESSWLLNTPIAHRGFHSGDAGCPENSMKAFERAIQKGFAIELDVCLLADNNLAVFHDNNLKRMTGIERDIRSCDSYTVKKLRLFNSDEYIPLFEEVLDIVKGKVPLLIELKNGGRIGKPEKALFETMKDYDGKYAVQSFNPYSLHWFRNNAPDVVRGQVFGYNRGENLIYNARFILKNFLFNRASQFNFINYDIRWLPIWAINTIREKGIPIIGWTARSIPEYQWAEKWCDNVVFEGFDPSWPVDKECIIFQEKPVDINSTFMMNEVPYAAPLE
ncbi:MAG: glycerophosphodiester phosphodiesterase [Methanosarcinales archaeon]|nr:glycerophosphodiester phosphodiesterase [Methanosarcinales archaeon]